MKIGLVGYQSSGKTTLFEALSGSFDRYEYSEKQRIHNVKVPDSRIDMLSSIFCPKKTIYANIDFVDFPGFITSQNNMNLDQNTIQKLKELDGYLVVLDGFSLNREYKDDMESFLSEIMLNDLVLLEQRLNSLKKANNLEGEYPVLKRIYESLNNNIPVIETGLTGNESETIRHYRFLSQKPCLFVVNSGKDEFPSSKSDSVFYINALLEREIRELPPEDQEAFLRELGYEEPLANRVLRKIYSLLDLISFITVGSDEVRAWTLKKGSNALKAAYKIHSDIAKGFIRAEVISYDDFSEYKSLPLARRAGRLRSEGKDYTVRDGDIIDFKFNI